MGIIFCMLLMENVTGIVFAPTPHDTYSGDILYVGGNGPNNYTKIQDAIDDATENSRIMVYPGIYNESIILDKPLSLIGISEDGLKPIINGGDSNATVTIVADGCRVRNFGIRLHNTDGRAVYVLSSYNTIENCDVSSQDTFLLEYGIFLENSKHTEISNNTIQDDAITYNLYLRNCNNCIIRNNTLSDTLCIALYLENSSNNVIEKNKIWAFHLTSSSDNNTISRNFIFGEYNHFHISHSNNNLVINNTISCTVWVYLSFKNTFINNLLESFLRIEGSPYTIIRDNSFIGEYSGILLEFITKDMSTSFIIENNTLNGKPILYVKNKIGFIIFRENIGQLILAGCRRCTISHVTLEAPLQILYSSHNTVSHCNLSGLVVWRSKNNLFKFNSISRAVSVYFSAREKFYMNRLNLTYMDVYGSRHTSIIRNDIKGSIFFTWCFRNIVTRNNFWGYIYIGIKNSLLNIFYRNYWEHWKSILPKPIRCRIVLIEFPEVPSGIYYYIFDWAPRLRPYSFPHISS